MAARLACLATAALALQDFKLGKHLIMGRSMSPQMYNLLNQKPYDQSQAEETGNAVSRPNNSTDKSSHIGWTCVCVWRYLPIHWDALFYTILPHRFIECSAASFSAVWDVGTDGLTEEKEDRNLRAVGALLDLLLLRRSLRQPKGALIGWLS